MNIIDELEGEDTEIKDTTAVAEDEEQEEEVIDKEEELKRIKIYPISGNISCLLEIRSNIQYENIDNQKVKRFTQAFVIVEFENLTQKKLYFEELDNAPIEYKILWEETKLE